MDWHFRSSIAIAPPAVLHSTVPPLPSARVTAPDPPMIAAPVAIQAPPERVPIPDPTLTPETAMGDALRAQYVSLARELGINQPGLLKDAASAYFRDRGTRLYDRAKVKAYLDDQYGKERSSIDHRFGGQTMNGQPIMRGIPTWCWRPLRAQDVVPLTGNQMSFGYNTPERNDETWFHASPYGKPLPLPVLLTVKEIATQFPDARMYVSDDVQSWEHKTMNVLDPFLLIVVEGERFIVERWDEPAYRE